MINLDEIAYFAHLFEDRLGLYHWDLMPTDWITWKNEYNSLDEASARECYLHEPWFPGEE